eukprot:gb/GEZN01001547.1/.p1 GENE.gb/GEZN01001547.1/~~gb/GEZN01001547.1/.p1  ORF type:complete len:842 (+),score=172.04 gb/GEZN01001547.1/:176-2527(+)
MAFGVENAAVICPVLSAKYQASRNCKKELNYADTLAIPSVPILGEAGFKSSGWLGALVAGLDQVDASDVSTTEKFDALIKHLVREITTLWGNAIGKGRRSSAEEWNLEEVASMLVGLQMEQYETTFRSHAVDGKMLLKLTDQELKDELKVNLPLHRRRLLLEIEVLKNSSAPKLYRSKEDWLKLKQAMAAEAKEKAAVASSVVKSVTSEDAALSARKVKSMNTGVSTTVGFHNTSDVTVDVFWINYEGDEVFYNTLRPGGKYQQQTYLQHPWVARDKASGDFVLLNGTRLLFPEEGGTTGVISSYATFKQEKDQRTQGQQKCVMLSYQQDSRPLCLQIYNALNAKGIPCYIDEESDDNMEEISKVVERAAVCIPVMTSKYQQSRNCQKECNYADTCSVPLAPVMAQQGFKQSGWLGAITAGLLWVDFTSPTILTDVELFQSKIDHLVREIQNVWENALGLGFSTPPPEWSVDDVLNLLSAEALDEEKVVAAFRVSCVDGPLLLSLTDEDLSTHLQMSKPLHRKKLLTLIETLKLAGAGGGAKKDNSSSSSSSSSSSTVSSSSSSASSSSPTTTTRAEAAAKTRQHKVKSMNSGISTHVNFHNTSELTVDVLWVDYGGEEVHYSTLKPGQKYRQQTYVEHPWVCRDHSTGDYVLLNGARLLFPEEGDATMGTISSYSQVSAAGALAGGVDLVETGDGDLIGLASTPAPKKAEFINQAQQEIVVIWIGYDGKQNEMKTLKAQEKYSVATYPGHPWIARKVKDKARLRLNGARVYYATKDGSITIN